MSDAAPRVLVVDDEPVMRQILIAVLGKLGCDVVAEADTDQAAMTAFKTTSPDFTLLDINLGDSNGLDVLRRIKGIARDARVVMLTATDDTTVAEHCLVNGAQGYIVKGDGADALEAAIAHQLKLSAT